MTVTGATTLVERPELTLPKAEADWLRAAYEDASVILEYGSGGSTVMASEIPGKAIWSVESDKNWANMMKAWFENEPGLSKPNIVYANVGPTGQWGMPEDKTHSKRFPGYPLGVWKLDGFQQPDVVLVDGRFRVGCFLATLYQCTKPVTLFFDDYVGREPYHVVESFLPVAETRGRMVRFEITPSDFPKERLLEVIQLIGRLR